MSKNLSEDSCDIHKNLTPTKPCTCALCYHGDDLMDMKQESPDCEYKNHNCEYCDAHAMECKNFREWMKLRQHQT